MSDKVKERIEKEAAEYVSKILGTEADGVWRRNAIKDYIAGATTERPKAWNEAIDACVACLDKQQYALFDKQELEKLKHKQP